MSHPKLTPEVLKLKEAATEARKMAYAPYSGHKVGAAIELNDGRIYTGCNVENSSYGGTVCAERVAIQKAVSENGAIKIKSVLVVTDATPPWPPCGFCRQVIAEFAERASMIYSCNIDDGLRGTTFGELFPEAFTPAHLVRK